MHVFITFSDNRNVFFYLETSLLQLILLEYSIPLQLIILFWSPFIQLVLISYIVFTKFCCYCFCVVLVDNNTKISWEISLVDYLYKFIIYFSLFLIFQFLVSIVSVLVSFIYPFRRFNHISSLIVVIKTVSFL